MKLINVSQRSPEWRQWRLQGVSASEAAIIMNRSPYKSPWRLWAEKSGRVLEQSLDNNPLIRFGIEQEPIALQHYEDKHGVLLLPVCAESERYPLMRASFDGLSESDEPVEVKCPHETTFLDVLLNREQSPTYQLYWCQVQQQLLVSEADRGFLYFYYQGQSVEFVVGRDDTFLTQLTETAMDFWALINTGQEPEKDPSRDLYLPDSDHEAQWQQLAASYRQNAAKMDDLKSQLKALDDQQFGIEQQLLGLMGDYLAAEHSGLRISRFQVQGSIDYKTALADMVPAVTESALAHYRKPPSQRVRITCRDDDGRLAEVPFDTELLNGIAGLDCWF